MILGFFEIDPVIFQHHVLLGRSQLLDYNYARNAQRVTTKMNKVALFVNLVLQVVFMQVKKVRQKQKNVLVSYYFEDSFYEIDHDLEKEQ